MKSSIKTFLRQEVLIALLLFLLPLILFFPQTLGGKTLIPSENLYQYAPFSAYREAVNAPEQVHNGLLDDLILQNYQWKTFLNQNIQDGEIPLWNPHQFAGQPFIAAGQQSTFYPLSILFYIMPIPSAYGWFTVLNLFIAGWLMVLFVRNIGVSILGALIAGITYQLSGFFIASVVHPMIVSAGAWLPLMLLMAEFIIRDQRLFGRKAVSLWVVIGAGALGCSVFAGHPEILIYNLLITAFYAGGRLLGLLRERKVRPALIASGWVAGFVILGMALGAVQFLPMYETASNNWRQQRTSLEQVLSYAHPVRDVALFLMPNVYGSPAHHSYFDVFNMENVPITENSYGETINHTGWGIKNYVEGASYVGILPLFLALFGLLAGRRKIEQWIFLVMTLLALTFMFGLPTYALVYYLPGVNQLNTAFRWIFAVTVGVSVLAGFGMDALRSSAHLKNPHKANSDKANTDKADKTNADKAGLVPTWFARVGVIGGGALLLGLGISRLFYPQISGVVETIFHRLALADRAFPSAQAFYSYQFANLLILGVVLIGVGLVFGLAHRLSVKKWGVLAVGVLALDLLIGSWGFNSASDPLLLEFKPPVVEWLQAQEQPYRYISLEDVPNGRDNMLRANATLSFGLDDVRGYESIISSEYVAYMAGVQEQYQLDANRIMPLYTDLWDRVNWERLDWLNVGYIVTHSGVDVPEPNDHLIQVYDDGVSAVYFNENAFTRLYIAEGDLSTAETADFKVTSDLKSGDITIIQSTTREITAQITSVSADTPVSGDWIVYNMAYADGWRAFVRPDGVDADGNSYPEQSVPVQRVLDIFIGVDTQDIPFEADSYQVRFVYNPTSFQVGGFLSAMGGALALFLVGVWVWGVLVGDGKSGTSGTSIVARNSLAPIILNLFNRGIDLVFAAVMLRLLGAEQAGVYYYLTVIFVWFDIVTNFGLDLYVIREASRERLKAMLYLLNSSYVRLALMVLCIPLLLAFMFVRQSFIEPALDNQALIAMALLYIGLAPASINKGLTSIFYAFQKAEIPAAVTTITTINKAVLGVFALLMGYGIVGLAGVSILLNLITLAILFWSARRVMREADVEDVTKQPDGALIKSMTTESRPLMFNHFLATIFFQIDVILLEALRGAVVVAQYSVAYKWLMSINVVPAFFTQALFPVMSRQWSENPPSLKRSYTLAIKIMVALTIPLAILFSILAETLTIILGGAEYLPGGAVALQIVIWSIPFGWANSVTQYALIAVEKQRAITRAYIMAVVFNVVANLIFIPPYGYQAAAVITILSELVLFIPFAYLMQSALGRINWFDIAWRPCMAGLAMAGAVLVLGNLSMPLAIVGGGVVYSVAFILLRPLNDEERRMVMPIVPKPLHRLLG
jgi:O-antigen/teichoic acid export membrane protein